jgi:hypothetical protein
MSMPNARRPGWARRNRPASARGFLRQPAALPLLDPAVGTFLLNVDTHFPRLTQPKSFGLQLAPGAGAFLTFDLKVPTATEMTNYMGQSCLMRLNNNGLGQYLDRGLFVFEVH